MAEHRPAKTEPFRFGVFEIDPSAGELRKHGVRIKLQDQPLAVLLILLEKRGQLVTKEELQQRLWPADTFVEFDKGIYNAMKRLRETLSDEAETPRYIETVPRRGYRFIAEIKTPAPASLSIPVEFHPVKPPWRNSTRITAFVLGGVLLALIASATLILYRRAQLPRLTKQRVLARLTFDDGLQIGATWSPDGRFIAYRSDRGGKFDIWVRQVSGGDTIQITKGPGTNWQPDWSPDGKYIAYRSENGDGGLYIVPALGGSGLAKKVAPFGYYPHWSPDGSQLLFQTTQYLGMNRFHIVGLEGGQPREVLTEFRAKGELIISAAWYPGGQRVSVWVDTPQPEPDFRIVPLQRGPAVKATFIPAVAQQLNEVSQGIVGQAMDFKFSWAPSGRAIYCSQTFRGALNLLKLTVEPSKMLITGIERLTTGPGPDSELSLSRDGSKLAFTAEAQQIRAWIYPFNASGGKVEGPGHPVTPAGISTWRHSLSRDGRYLAFSGNHAGSSQVWRRSLDDAGIFPVVNDECIRDNPRWSPDGKRLLYRRVNGSTNENLLVLWSAESGDETPICDASNIDGSFDWLPDNNSFLVSRASVSGDRLEIWQLSTNEKSRETACGRKLISDPSYDLYQPNLSPDGRWVAFAALRDSPTAWDSTLYVVPTSGGRWTKITGGEKWADKPRWSPDGKIIYFISRRDGFFNIWGIHFDPALGIPLGAAFPVTSFSAPTLGMPLHLPSLDVSLNEHNLVLTVEQVSGNLWSLDNVDQ